MSSRLSSRTGCRNPQALTDCAVAANDCRLMSRPLIAHRAIVVVLLVLAACGKKGPPLAPLRVAPARIDDLAVAKTGEEVRLRFTVPSANADQTKPADLVAVEVYAISGKPEDPAGNSLAGPQFVRFGKLVGRVKATLGAVADVIDHDAAVARELDDQVWSVGQPAFAERLAAARTRTSDR